MAKPGNKRAREAIGKLNKIRHEQSQKIDILCNDMVSAHSDFVQQLRMLNFGVGFYESLLGKKDIPSVLSTAAEKIQECVANSSVAVFLNSSDRFEVHLGNDNYGSDEEMTELEGFFTREITHNISHSSTIHNLDEIAEMSIDASPAVLSKISAVAIPLGRIADSAGFILVYRYIEHPLDPREIQTVASITAGFCSAIKAVSGNESQKPVEQNG